LLVDHSTPVFGGPARVKREEERSGKKHPKHA
jgi:hypothetical protein